MNQFHKEIICLSVGYLDMYLAENKEDNKDIFELFDLLRNELYYNICSKNMNIALKLTDTAESRVQLATAGQTIEVNVLMFALQCCFILVEDGVFNGSKAMQLARLANSINTKLELKEGFTSDVKNSINLICKISEKIER